MCEIIAIYMYANPNLTCKVESPEHIMLLYIIYEKL